MTGPGTSDVQPQQNESPSSFEETRLVGPRPPPPICLGASRGVLDKMGLGKLTSLPSSGKSGPGSSLCLIRGGRGCRAPLHPIPSGQAGRGRGSDSWGRAGLGSLSISPPRPTSGGPPTAAAPGPPPVPNATRGCEGPGPGVAAARGQGDAAGPSWNKVRRPGPGSSRRGSRGQFANTK